MSQPSSPAVEHADDEATVSASSIGAPAPSTEGSPDHTRLIIILQHGNHGRASDFLIWETRLRQSFPDAIFYRPSCNERLKTHDGIQKLGDRMAQDTLNALGAAGVPLKDADGEAEKAESVHQSIEYKLVVVGHSLGGLILRAAMPALLDGLGENVEPLSFISLASPHLGSRRPPGQTAVRSLWKHAVHAVVGNLYGQTGKELLLEDEDRILFKMAEAEGKYMVALRRFRWCTFIGTSHGDLLVPFCSAVCCGQNPFRASAASDRPFTLVGGTGFPVDYEDVFTRYREEEAKSSKCCTKPPKVEQENSTKTTDDSAPPSDVRFFTSAVNKEFMDAVSPTAAGAGYENAAEIADEGADGEGMRAAARTAVEEYLHDTNREVEYPAKLLPALQASLPNLRRLVARYNLNVTLVHDAWIHKGLRHKSVGETKNGFVEVMVLFTDLIGLDLKTQRPSNPEATTETTAQLEEVSTN